MTENVPTPTPQITDLAAIRDRLMGIISMLATLDLAGARDALWVPPGPTSEDATRLDRLLDYAALFQQEAARYQEKQSAEFWARPGLPRAQEEDRDAGLP